MARGYTAGAWLACGAFGALSVAQMVSAPAGRGGLRLLGVALAVAAIVVLSIYARKQDLELRKPTFWAVMVLIAAYSAGSYVNTNWSDSTLADAEQSGLAFARGVVSGLLATSLAVAYWRRMTREQRLGIALGLSFVLVSAGVAANTVGDVLSGQKTEAEFQGTVDLWLAGGYGILAITFATIAKRGPPAHILRAMSTEPPVMSPILSLPKVAVSTPLVLQPPPSKAAPSTLLITSAAKPRSPQVGAPPATKSSDATLAQLLDERFIRGEISEDIYRELRMRFPVSPHAEEAEAAPTARRHTRALPKKRSAK